MTDLIRPDGESGQPDGEPGQPDGECSHPPGLPDTITAADRVLWQRFRRTAPAFSAGSVADPLLLAGWRDGRLTGAVEAMLVEDARRGGGRLDDLAAAVLAAPVPVSPALAARLRDLPDRISRPATAPTGHGGILARVVARMLDDPRPMHWLRAGSVAAMLLATLYAGGTAYHLGRDSGSADRSGVAGDGWNLGDSGADLDAGDVL